MKVQERTVWLLAKYYRYRLSPDSISSVSTYLANLSWNSKGLFWLTGSIHYAFATKAVDVAEVEKTLHLLRDVKYPENLS